MSHAALHQGEIEMQRRRGVLAQAERVAAMIRTEIPEVAARFLAQQPFAIAAVIDASGRPWAGLWSGDPGFLEVRDSRTVRVRRGNLDALTRRKGVLPASVGLLAIDLATRRRMRINGTARCLAVGEAEGLELLAQEVYSNCPKYIQKRHLEKSGQTPGQPREGQTLEARQRRWIARADTLFVASHNPRSGADASHRGGEPGFVRWLDERRCLMKIRKLRSTPAVRALSCGVKSADGPSRKERCPGGLRPSSHRLSIQS